MPAEEDAVPTAKLKEAIEAADRGELFPFECEERLKILLDKIEAPKPMTDSNFDRVSDLRREMNDRFRQIDHDAQRKHEFRMGFLFGLIGGTLAWALLILFFAHVK